jgi:hypothetical protein
MPKISKQKRDKISEQILAHLFNKSPEPQFTAHISQELARDEEFTLSILKELEKNKLVVKITKNPHGIDYLRRQRWRLSNSTFDIYKKHQ